MQEFYAYTHARPDGRVFYVGKGCGNRAYAFSENRNNHYRNVVNKHGADNILVGKIPCSSEEIALELEKGLIKCFRKMGVDLVNLTDGGDGVSGYRWPKEQLEALRESRLADVQRPYRRDQARQQMLTENPMRREDVREKHLRNVRAATASELFKSKQAEAKRGNTYTKDYVWLNDGKKEWLEHKDVAATSNAKEGRLTRVWVCGKDGSKFVTETEAALLIEAKTHLKGRKLNKELCDE